MTVCRKHAGHREGGFAAPDSGRRRFLGRAALTLAAAGMGLAGTTEANQREPRHFAALRRATEWLNSAPLGASSLLGKVVLVQFGTYSCINWLRTLPYVRAWSETYRQGLVVIGVHTPEFTFEKNMEHVRHAVRQLKLQFPIAIDSSYGIWRAFNNQYWPALYFIDARGRLRDHQFGEGEYEQSGEKIRALIAETGARGDDKAVAPIAASGLELQADWRNLKTPEMYVGYGRAENFARPEAFAQGRRRFYRVPNRLRLNEWALGGDWTMGSEATVLDKAPGRIVCRFHARDVHLVMGSVRPASPVRLRVTLDGQRPGPARGLDVDDSGNGTVSEPRLYQLLRQPGPIAERTCEIEFLDAGVEAFSFTFG